MESKKRNSILVILGFVLLLLVVLIIWQLRDDAADAGPSIPEPTPTTTPSAIEAKLEEARKVQEAHTPPSREEREAQLEVLKEKENPYQLSTDERKAQLEALQNR